MTLIPGARLGPYEVVSLLGCGGMGEVYKARDTRLERTVAVKILPSTSQAGWTCTSRRSLVLGRTHACRRPAADGPGGAPTAKKCST